MQSWVHSCWYRRISQHLSLDNVRNLDLKAPLNLFQLAKLATTVRSQRLWSGKAACLVTTYLELVGTANGERSPDQMMMYIDGGMPPKIAPRVAQIYRNLFWIPLCICILTTISRAGLCLLRKGHRSLLRRNETIWGTWWGPTRDRHQPTPIAFRNEIRFAEEYLHCRVPFLTGGFFSPPLLFLSACSPPRFWPSSWRSNSPSILSWEAFCGSSSQLGLLIPARSGHRRHVPICLQNRPRAQILAFCHFGTNAEV
jgi:hypothetical protein